MCKTLKSWNYQSLLLEVLRDHAAAQGSGRPRMLWVVSVAELGFDSVQLRSVVDLPVG